MEWTPKMVKEQSCTKFLENQNPNSTKSLLLIRTMA